MSSDAKRDRLGRLIKHGLTKTPTYQAWSMMKQRCYNPKTERFECWGGRGIRVCERWLGKKVGFLNFLADMGIRPSKEHTLDRINNDGDYEPGNCRWATRTEQNRNKSDCVILEHDGKRMTIAEWARHVGLEERTLAHRIQNGWDVPKALATPSMLTGPGRKKREEIVDREGAKR